MKKNITRTLLASVAAVAVTLSLPTIQTFGPDHLSSAAFARGGSDDGGGSSSGSSGGGNSGSGRSGGSDDHSGSGRGGDDHGGRGGHDDGNDDHRGGRDDGAAHDRNDDNPGERRGGRRNDNRPEVTLAVSDANLSRLLSGSLRAVDQLGRRLEVEVELEHGTRVVKVHPHGGDAVRNPGAITSVNIVPASAQ